MKLKTVLKMDIVQGGILSNLFHGDEESFKDGLGLALDTAENSDKVYCDVFVDGDLSSFETCLYRDKNKEYYLLESRLFSEDGGLVGTYLELFNDDGELIDDFIEDVFEFANWDI